VDRIAELESQVARLSRELEEARETISLLNEEVGELCERSVADPENCQRCGKPAKEDK